MAQTYRAQIAVWHDSLDPRDAMCVDPVFHVAGTGGFDPQSLSDDLAAAVSTKISNQAQVRTRFYELPYVRGVGHVAETIKNKGLSPASTLPREQALCLSFYGQRNVPRQRGRLYLPIVWLGSGYGGVRPTSPMMTAAMSWRTMLEGLGGLNVDWSVWSTRNAEHYPVTFAWVDDEHDTVRSRGLKPTTRITQVIGEDTLPNLVRLNSALGPVTDEEVQLIHESWAAADTSPPAPQPADPPAS